MTPKPGTEIEDIVKTLKMVLFNSCRTEFYNALSQRVVTYSRNYFVSSKFNLLLIPFKVVMKFSLSSLPFHSISNQFSFSIPLLQFQLIVSLKLLNPIAFSLLCRFQGIVRIIDLKQIHLAS